MLSQVVQQKPDNAEAWFLLGVSQFNLKDYAAAAESLEKAQALAPSASTAANLGAASTLLANTPMPSGYFRRL